MNRSDFKTLYCGTDTRKAETYLDNGCCCALIYCEHGYGVALLDKAKVELHPETMIALKLGGRSVGISLSADFFGRFTVCSGDLVSAIFDYYLNGAPFRAARIKTLSQREAVHSRSLQKETPEAVGLYDIHTMLHKIFGEKNDVTSSDTKLVSVAETIKDYIDRNIDKKITLQQISDIFFIGKTQIYRVFTAKYDTPPMKYMLRKKIEASKEMLTKTEMKISEIAEALSFTDSKHYTKTFRSLTGMLPGEYRKSICEGATSI